jgi:hypothetical protein
MGEENPIPNERRMPRVRLLHVLLVLLVGVCFLPLLKPFIRKHMPSVINLLRREDTVFGRVREFRAAVEARRIPDFQRAGVPFPPEEILLLGIKDARVLRLLARQKGERWQFIRDYPFTAGSGDLGPKLREWDMQIPEGFYRVESLNPNSSYHLSMRLNYPNEFDVAKAIVDGRTELGSDIFIHGSVASIGCIAIGDPAIEEVFVLAALTGVDAVTVIIVPVDFRVRELPDGNSLPPWSEELYGPLREAVRGLPGADG